MKEIPEEIKRYIDLRLLDHNRQMIERIQKPTISMLSEFKEYGSQQLDNFKNSCTETLDSTYSYIRKFIIIYFIIYTCIAIFFRYKGY